MAQQISLSLVGDTDIKSALSRLESKIAKKFSKIALTKAAFTIRPTLKNLISERSQSGASGNVNFKTPIDKEGVMTAVLRSPTRRMLSSSNKNYNSNSKYYYPAIQELGSKKRGISPQGAYKRAFSMKRGEAMSAMAQSLRQQISRA